MISAGLPIVRQLITPHTLRRRGTVIECVSKLINLSILEATSHVMRTVHSCVKYLFLRVNIFFYRSTVYSRQLALYKVIVYILLPTSYVIRKRHFCRSFISHVLVSFLCCFIKFRYMLFILFVVYVPLNSYGHIKTLPPLYGTSSQHWDVVTCRKCFKLLPQNFTTELPPLWK